MANQAQPWPWILISAHLILSIVSLDPILIGSRLIFSGTWMETVKMMYPPWGLSIDFLMMMMLLGPLSVPIMAQGIHDARHSWLGMSR